MGWKGGKNGGGGGTTRQVAATAAIATIFTRRGNDGVNDTMTAMATVTAATQRLEQRRRQW
jgi:hypothetical protein